MEDSCWRRPHLSSSTAAFFESTAPASSPPLHQYDCLRANKSTSAWGLEIHVPFLDKEFIDVAMAMDPEWKMYNKDLGRIEKWVMRKAFDDEENPYLPKHILYRQKEQFSDGVGYSWIDGLKAFTEQQITDEMMINAAKVYPYNTPVNKEAYYYRMIFERIFPQDSARETVPGGNPLWLDMEDAKKGVHFENLTEHEISNAREALQQLIEVHSG